MQKHDESFPTIQLNNFNNDDTVEVMWHIDRLGYDEISCDSINKIDHSIDLNQSNKNNANKEIAVFCDDSITYKTKGVCTVHGEHCKLLCDNM